MEKINHFLKTNLFVSQDELIASIKKHPEIQSLVELLNISDQEIWDNFVLFNDLLSEKRDPSKYLYRTILYRDNNQNLCARKQINNTKEAKEYLLEHNLAFSNISRPITKISIEEQEGINESNHFDLYNFRSELLEKIDDKDNLKNIKGCYLEGAANSLRSTVLSNIANSFALRDYKVAYININYLEDELKKGFNSTDNESNFIVDTLAKIDVLVLDEIGFKNYNPWYIENILIKILEQRELNQKITFLGSYVSVKNIKSIINNKENKISSFAIEKLQLLIKKLCKLEMWIGK
ncbi:hypothetical protein [Mycoplasma hafezii]|uniref:hypothetical protein n=1 Tax=Mycoplasma hafezii TaxID=525886 RepID=UPI003CEA5E37